MTKQVLGRTAEGREIVALTLGGDSSDKRPAVLVLGSVQADSLVGDAMSFRMVEQLVERIDSGDEEARALIDAVTFYVVPRPSPDASERFFAKPYFGSATNSRPTDDDRDGRVDEDPPADLNGDGWITQMRVADPAGEWIVHPDDDRVMVKADPAKGEVGEYRLLTEDNADDDDDGRFAEDAVGGVDFNRNFTFEYPYFKPGAGPHQVSEPESRAITDFAFDHPNIFLVFSFAPQANLLEAWKAGGDAAGVVKTVADLDAPYFKWMAERYSDRFKPKGFAKPSPPDGSFATWAYFHYGRWSLATPGWWPSESQKESDTEDKSDNEADEPADKEDKKKPTDDRGKEDRRRLAWLEGAGVDGFVPWTSWEGPTPDGLRGKVEVGGFKPFVASHPPVEELDPLSTKHLEFLLELVDARPNVVATKHEVEVTGGIRRQEVTVINRGRLPTVTRPGEKSRQIPRLEIALELPDGTELLVGPGRRRLGRLDPGGAEEITWLWQADGDAAPAAMGLGFAFERDAEGRLPAVNEATEKGGASR